MKWEFLGFVGNLIYPTEETFAVNKMETFTIGRSQVGKAMDFDSIIPLVRVQPTKF